MHLTSDVRESIDSLSYESLLYAWRFAPVGDPRFLGASGGYWLKRINKLKAQDPEGAVAASKRLMR